MQRYQVPENIGKCRMQPPIRTRLTKHTANGTVVPDCTKSGITHL